MIVSDNLYYKDNQKYIVALGKFDGIHKGHNEIILRMSELKKKYKDSKLCIITFKTSPDYLLGKCDRRVVMSLDSKRKTVANLGIDLYIECEFDENVKNIKAGDFVQNILIDNLHMTAFVAGEDVKFGKNGEGDADFIRNFALKDGTFDAVIIPKLKIHGDVVSSSNIATYIQSGNLAKASEMLGRYYRIDGVVERGKSLGNMWDVPTVNVIPQPDIVIPPFGVYFSFITIDDSCYKSITNIGVNPTTDKESDVVKTETFILDFNGDLYDRNVSIDFIEFVRPEKRFDSLDDLYIQIKKDVEKRKKY